MHCKGGRKMTIPEYSLSIDPKQMKKIKKEKWSKRLVPATLEVDEEKYSVMAGYRGSYTRKFKKKSFSIEFPDPMAFQNQKMIHLNAEYNDYSLLRSKLSFDLFKKLNVMSPHAEHVFLTLNGTISSIYLKLDSIDEYFLANNELPSGPIYYAQNDDANFSLLRPDDHKPKYSLLDGYLRKYGNEEDDQAVMHLIYKINTLRPEEFKEEISKVLNVESYISWLCGVVCTQNFDAFIQNYALYQNRESGKFEIVPWDYDATWGRDINGRLMEYDYIPITGYNTLTARILDCKDLKQQYKNKLEALLDTTFKVEELEPEIRKHHKRLRPYVERDAYHREVISYFDSEPEFILNYIRDRNAHLRKELNKL